MNSNIQFPQGPFVDLTTGYVTQEWMLWLLNPQFISINLGVVVAVGSGGTGLSSGTSGGILGFIAPTVIASSGLLAANQLVLGGGAGATPSTLGSLGSATTVLHGNAGGAPTFGAVANADLVNASVTINGKAVALGSAITLALASADFANQGTTTTVLHGNAGGNPSFGAVVLTTDVSGRLPSGNGGSDAWASFTTTRTGWTDVGSPTVTSKFSKSGNTCFFEIEVVPGTTVATVAGTSYCSLPATAAGYGDASMQDLTSLISVGDCVIDKANSRVYVPSKTATGDTLTIAGWFQC